MQYAYHTICFISPIRKTRIQHIIAAQWWLMKIYKQMKFYNKFIGNLHTHTLYSCVHTHKVSHTIFIRMKIVCLFRFIAFDVSIFFCCAHRKKQPEKELLLEFDSEAHSKCIFFFCCCCCCYCFGSLSTFSAHFSYTAIHIFKTRAYFTFSKKKTHTHTVCVFTKNPTRKYREIHTHTKCMRRRCLWHTRCVWVCVSEKCLTMNTKTVHRATSSVFCICHVWFNSGFSALFCSPNPISLSFFSILAAAFLHIYSTRL